MIKAYKPRNSRKVEFFDKLKRQETKPIIIDAFKRQIKELFIIDNLEFVGQEKKKIYGSKEFGNYKRLKADSFKYYYYPWNNTLVKCVEEEDYFRLKTDRNRDLIREDEQKMLYDYKVAVFGMSVGSNISIAIAQAGISKNMVIADFDELDTTNMNRILAGVHQIGLNKTTIAARRIYEDNPFANVTVLDKGINKVLLEQLLKEGKIECIVEEIDDMPMKIEIRKLAIKYKVPVLMITDNGDRAVLHIERYDLGYKKIFEEDIKYWDKKMKKCKTPKDFADIIINNIVGDKSKVDPRMMDSVMKVFQRKFVSWPQLGSAALLGSVAVTVAIKQILRGEDKKLFRKEYLRIY